MKKQDITVVVVCYNEEQNIHDCLSSLCNQDINITYNILVVDGKSIDNTVNIVAKFARENADMRLVDNPRRFIAHGRNIGWKQAETSLIAYTDADCIVPPDWLSTLFEAYKQYKEMEPRLAAVGGGNKPPRNTKFYQALALFVSSYFGNRGSVQGKILRKMKWVPHIPTLNLMCEREALEEIGGFDESFGNVGEDEDMTFRLRKNGRMILYVSDCIILHRSRSSLKTWAKNIFVYGVGRAHLMKKHAELRKVQDGLPLLVPLSIILIVFAYSNCLLFLPFLFYLLFFISVSLYLCIKRKKGDLVCILFAMFVIGHFFYAIGMIKGMFTSYK